MRHDERSVPVSPEAHQAADERLGVFDAREQVADEQLGFSEARVCAWNILQIVDSPCAQQRVEEMPSSRRRAQLRAEKMPSPRKRAPQCAKVIPVCGASHETGAD